MTARRSPEAVALRGRWAGLLLAALVAVLGLLLAADTASASGLPVAEIRVGAIGPTVTVSVGVAEHIAAGQHLGRAPSQLRHVVGHCVAAEAGADAAATTGLRDAAESCANSFTADTPVLMADGKEEPIADVKVGDKVLATDPETGKTQAGPVAALIRHSGKHTMVELTLDDGSKIATTDHHPFWDASTHTFTDAIDLRVGDQVLSESGRTLTITTERVYVQTLAAYNLQIDGIHTYYAGITPILVHNSCISSADVLKDPAALEGLTPSQVDDLARNAGYDILPGKAGAANDATRYYLPGTNGSVGFRVLPGGVAGQSGIKGDAYLKFFGGDLGGLPIPLRSP